MFDRLRTKREWRMYVEDMRTFVQLVLEFTNGLDQRGFVADRKTYDATLRNLELIGEAAGNVPEEVRNANPSIPWRQIIATRNKLIHGYLGIDNDTIWSIIQEDIPELLSELGRLPTNR